MIINKPYVLTEIKRLSPSVLSFSFKAQDGESIDFTPGMFAMLQYKDATFNVSRAFSMANAPPSDHFEFLIAMIHGTLTSRLESAKAGDIYYISAPYGQFKFDINAGRKVLFLAGGTGIAPFISMLRYAKALGADIDCSMIYSVKFPSEILNKDELEQMKSSMKLSLNVTVTRSQEGDGWIGATGHVNAEMIKRFAPDFKERVTYICGPPEFVKALKEALTGLGVNEREIKAEMWG